MINAARRTSQSSHDAFARFLATLPTLISSEADVTGYSGQDPALDHWIREAEAARQTSLDQVDYLHSELGPNATGHERLFFEIAAAFQTIMTSDDIEDVAALRTQTRALHERLTDELQALTMSVAALDRLESYLALDDAFEGYCQVVGGVCSIYDSPMNIPTHMLRLKGFRYPARSLLTRFGRTIALH